MNFHRGFCVSRSVSSLIVPAALEASVEWSGGALIRVRALRTRPSGAPSLALAPERMEDQQLAQRCLGGDAHAWEELVRRHGRRVYNLCLRFTGNPADAEDLAQEAVVRVYRALAAYDAAQGSLQTWIAALTRNLLIDHYRRARNQRRTDSLDALAAPLPLPAEPRRQPEAELYRREMRELIERGLARLSPELREAVILRDLQDMDYKEIAQVLRLPEGTVKSRINRGRIELARILKHRISPPPSSAAGAVGVKA